MGAGFSPHVPKRYRLVVRYTRSPPVYQQKHSTISKNEVRKCPDFIISTILLIGSGFSSSESYQIPRWISGLTQRYNSFGELNVRTYVSAPLVSHARVVSSRTNPFWIDLVVSSVRALVWGSRCLIAMHLLDFERNYHIFWKLVLLEVWSRTNILQRVQVAICGGLPVSQFYHDPLFASSEPREFWSRRYQLHE